MLFLKEIVFLEKLRYFCLPTYFYSHFSNFLKKAHHHILYQSIVADIHPKTFLWLIFRLI